MSGPTLDWTWPLSLYEHGAGRELSTRQRDDYKEPVIEVVPVSDRDRIWVNEGRTVMVRLWANGTMEISTRVSPDALWPPPIYVLEEK